MYFLEQQKTDTENKEKQKKNWSNQCMALADGIIKLKNVIYYIVSITHLTAIIHNINMMIQTME